MSRFFKKVSKKAGLAPGSLVSISEKKMEKVRITILDYDEKNISEWIFNNTIFVLMSEENIDIDKVNKRHAVHGHDLLRLTSALDWIWTQLRRIGLTGLQPLIWMPDTIATNKIFISFAFRNLHTNGNRKLKNYENAYSISCKNC